MRRVAMLTAVVALASALNVWAGEAAGEKPAIVWGQGKSAATWYIESIDKTVNLTDQQKKTITAIIEARDKAMQDFRTANAEKLKAASNAMMEAYKSKNQDATAKAQKEYQDLYAPMHEAMKKSQTDLDNVLTAEQKEKLQDSRVMTAIKSATTPLELSAEQIKQIKAALPKGEPNEALRKVYDTVQQVLTAEQKEKLQDLRVMATIKATTAPVELSAEQIKQIKAALPQGGQPWQAQAKVYEVVQQVLTAEQKVAITKHRNMSYVKSMYGRAKLTEEQLKQAEAACEALAKDPNVKPNELYLKLKEKVDALLTDEQKKAMSQPGRMGGAGGMIVLPGGPLEKKPAEKK
jgi:Spy/CpxP family protein refolding chaperone